MSGPSRTPKKNESLAIGWIYPGEVSGLFMQSVCNYLIEDAARGKDSRMNYGKGGTIGLMSGPRIAHARNLLVDTFLRETKADWLLMVDSDMTFSTEDIDTLFDVADPEEVPIVGGLCFGAPIAGPMFPTLYVFRDASETEDGEIVQKVWDYPDYGLCRVDGTGAAFLLMHRGALEKMGQTFAGDAPWFCEGTVYKGMSFGEDMAFCARAMAVDLPIHVHTGAKIGHVKPQVMDEAAYKRQRETGLGADTIKKLGMERV